MGTAEPKKPLLELGGAENLDHKYASKGLVRQGNEAREDESCPPEEASLYVLPGNAGFRVGLSLAEPRFDQFFELGRQGEVGGRRGVVPLRLRQIELFLDRKLQGKTGEIG